MIYINIIHPFGKVLFMHQLDSDRYKKYIHFAENSSEDIIWDYIVIFQNVNKELLGIKYKDGGLIFISGEPENAEPFCDRFFNQFDFAIVPHPHKSGPKIIHANPALNWLFGHSYSKGTFKYSYKDILEIDTTKKYNISMMCSNKTMLPGHILRYNFYQKLKCSFANEIDFYGAGIRQVDDKADIILPYRFHICIENSNDEHYWSEKISDSILGLSVPIYFGATNIDEYFPADSIVCIDINDSQKAINIIKKILENPKYEYEKRFKALVQARQLLMDKYNIFPMLESFIKDKHPKSNQVRALSIHPFTDYPEWIIRNYILRFKRLIYKIVHK